MSATLNRTEEEKRAAILIKYRRLTVRRVEREGDKTLIHLTRKGKKIITMCISNLETIGVAYVRELLALGEGERVEELILIGGGRYTYSAKKEAKETGVEMIPPSLPSFDVFKHKPLIPKHEILLGEKRKELLGEMHVEPYQFPWIKADDPIAIILGARPGDILKITRSSKTAGTYISYRYVVQ